MASPPPTVGTEELSVALLDSLSSTAGTDMLGLEEIKPAVVSEEAEVSIVEELPPEASTSPDGRIL